MKAGVVAFHTALISRFAAFLLAVSLGCSSSGDRGTQIALTIAYDSTIGVDRLVVWGTTEDGNTRLDQQTVAAPLSLDPPGVRSTRVTLEVAGAVDGEVVVVRVDGRDASGQVVGSGVQTVSLTPGGVVDAAVSLGAPVVCGDGLNSVTLEACDDGNAAGGDGCSDVCTVEEGYRCAGSPSVCGRCGDGTAQGREQCDDGNTADGDGCSSTCTLEDVDRRLIEVAVETSSTAGPDFTDIPGATLRFTPNDPSERWVVFVSGVIGSSVPDQVAAEMRLMVNGEEVDLLGHQTFGAEDNAAGFLTFETITQAADEQEIRPQFRAEAGVTTVENLRVVAALIPSGADFQWAEADALVERAGDDIDLLSLEFTPSSAGEYVVFAKSSFAEAPSTDTAQTWLEDDTGREMVRFSNPRDPWVPMFATAARSLDRTDKRFVLKGASSSTGDVTDWWNEAFTLRQAMQISGPAGGVPPDHPILVTFDHAAQVAAGRSLASGDDVWIVTRSMADGGLVPLNRVVDESSGWNRTDTQIWFSSFEQIPEGAVPEYWLYWGNATPGQPLEDPQEIFPLFDSFDGVQLDAARWPGVFGAPQVSDGELTLGPNAAVASTDGQARGAGISWEARVRFVAAQLTGELGVLTAGETFDGGGIGFFAQSEGLVGRAGLESIAIQVTEPLSYHTLRFVQRDLATVEFFLDGTSRGTLPAQSLSTAGNLRVQMMNQDPNASLVYDWVRVRPILDGPPTVDLGAVEGRVGAAPSTWRYQKMMAFRTDVFDWVGQAASLEEQSTFSPELLPLAELETEAPSVPTEELLIASMRVSGESSEVGRRSGVVLAGGEPIIRTAHRINRNSSRTAGYHHVAGVATARTATASAIVSVGIGSPDGIRVDGAGASIMVLRYPPR